jgi:DNA replication protein DnaC
MPGGIVITLGCPECARERDKELDREEQAREATSTDEAMRSANIEPEYYNATIDTYQADTPEQVKAVQTVKRLIAGEIQQIVMTGSNGTGKTHLAIAAVKELHGKIYSMYEITTRIRQSYSSRADETELEIVNELARLPMLAIDEVGRTKGSDAELNWLSYIIDKRHTRGLPTIIISNKHVRKHCPASGCPDCLENYLSGDVMSRLTDNGVLLQFGWADWRKTKRQREAQK